MPEQLRRFCRSHIVATGVLVMVGTFSLWLLHAAKSTAGLVHHTYEVISTNERSLSAILEMESASRGFLVTRDGKLFQSYQLSLKKISPVLSELQNLTSDNPTQVENVRILGGLVQKKIDFGARFVAMAKQSKKAASTMQLRNGSRLMERIRVKTAEINNVELRLLNERTRSFESSQILLVWLVVAIVGSTILFLLWSMKVSRQQANARAKAEQKLRVSEQRFQLLVEGVEGCAIFMLTPEGNISTWNLGANRIKGYEEKEIVGQHFSKFYTPEAIAEGRPQWVLGKAAKEGSFRDEGWRVRKDGSRFFAEVLVTAVRDAEGKLLCFSKVTRDITEKKAAEEALQKAYQGLEQMVAQRTRQLNEANLALKRSNAELERFASVAAHDLKEPLRTVAMFTRIITENVSADKREFADIVVKGATRMSLLIDELLKYSKVESVDNYRFEPVDSSATVKTVIFPVLGLDPHLSKTGFYIINKDEQQIVNDIFRHFLESGSLKVTSDYCRQKGYQTKLRFTREKIDRDGNRIPPKRVGGEEFDIRNLRALLQNPKLRGYDFFKDTWNQFTDKRDDEGYVRWNYAHGPVIEEEMFERVQKLLGNNRKKDSRGSKERRTYLLSGILITPDRVKFHGASAKSGQNSYYVNKKHKIAIPAERIEKIVIEYIEKIYKESGIWEKVLNDTLRDKNQKLYLITEEIARLKKAISDKEGYVETLRNGLYEASKLSPNSLVQAALKLAEEETRVKVEIEKLRVELNEQRDRQNLVDTRLRQDIVGKYVKECLEKFRNGDSFRRKQIIQAMVREVELRPDDRIEIRLNPWSACDKDEKVRVCAEWRGGRGSNPRPPA